MATEDTNEPVKPRRPRHASQPPFDYYTTDLALDNDYISRTLLALKVTRKVHAFLEGDEDIVFLVEDILIASRWLSRDVFNKFAKKLHHKHYEEQPEKHRACNRKYYKNHRNEILARNRKYHTEHREERNAYQRKYYETHREEHLARSRKYYETHREEHKAYQRKRYAEHREEELARHRKYREKHLEKCKAYQRKYYEEHREETNARKRAQRLAKKAKPEKD